MFTKKWSVECDGGQRLPRLRGSINNPLYMTKCATHGKFMSLLAWVDGQTHVTLDRTGEVSIVWLRSLHLKVRKTKSAKGQRLPFSEVMGVS